MPSSAGESYFLLDAPSARTAFRLSWEWVSFHRLEARLLMLFLSDAHYILYGTQGERGPTRRDR